ncbi:hypothetical protein D3C85_1140350 [compost metagenome]
MNSTASDSLHITIVKTAPQIPNNIVITLPLIPKNNEVKAVIFESLLSVLDAIR